MLDADEVRRLDRVADAVQARFEASEDFNEYLTTIYRWEHTQRVCQYGKRLAEAEGANLEWVLAGCLLHDVAHFEGTEGTDHGRVGAAMARPILEKAGYDESAVATICHAVAAHVDGEARDGLPDTIESDVVADADDIDRFTTYRLLQWGAPLLASFPTLCDEASRRLERLNRYTKRSPLRTKTGNRLFAEKLASQIAFMNGLLDDRSLTRLPWR
jgi:uncharacterized protein